MNTLEAIEKRSSTRIYKNTEISEEKINILIDAGLKAPTATNRQEIHFSVVKSDNPVLLEIDDEMKRLRDSSQKENFYYNAPVVIFLSAEEYFKWSPLDAGIAVENMALAAEDLGLGNVIIGCVYDALKGEKKDYFSKKLDFPDGYVYEIAIAIGEKAAEKTPHNYDKDAQASFIK